MNQIQKEFTPHGIQGRTWSSARNASSVIDFLFSERAVQSDASVRRFHAASNMALHKEHEGSMFGMFSRLFKGSAEETVTA